VYVWYRTKYDGFLLKQYVGYTDRGYLKFDLSGIDDSTVISSAVLWVKPTVANLSDGLDIWHVGDSWPGTPENFFKLLDKGSDTMITSVAGNSTLDWMPIDLLGSGTWNYASDLVDGVLSLAVINGREFEDPSSFSGGDLTSWHEDKFTFFSMDAGDSGPYLEIIPVPLPSAFLMLSGGLMGLVGFRKKLKN
jgi:hypothetical protein